MSTFAVLIFLSIIGKLSAQGPEGALLDAWVSTTVNPPASWVVGTDYCTWTGFACDGSSNLLYINYTCPLNDNFFGNFPPLDVWQASATAFKQTTSLLFKNCMLGGASIPTFMQDGSYWRKAPLNFFSDVSGIGSPWLQCPLPPFYAGGTQTLTCSNTAILSVTPFQIPTAGGEITVLLNKPAAWAGATCLFAAPSSSSPVTNITFADVITPNFSNLTAGRQAYLTCTAPAHSSGVQPLRIGVGSAIQTPKPFLINFNCPLGTFADLSTDPCTPCAAGTFQNKPFAVGQQCEMCPGGTFSAAGAIVCTKCLAGYVSIDGASVCTLCPTGTLANVTSCDPCPTGTYSPNVGSTGSCLPCENGYGAAAPGVTGLSGCPLCTAGTASGPSNETGGICQPCGFGLYSTHLGAIRCRSCPDGQATNSTYSTNVSECQLCQPGTARRRGEPGNNVTFCAPCREGYANPDWGQAVCNPCPRGYFSVGVGNTVCTQCANGTDNWAPGLSYCVDNYEPLQQSSLFGRIAGNGSTSAPGGSGSGGDRRTVGIVLVAIGGAVFVLALLILIVGGILAVLKFKELTAISNEIEKLKDLQNNRL